MQIPFQCTSRENRLAHLSAVGPDAELRRHEAGEGGASAKRTSTRSGQRDLRKELSFGNTDVGVRGNQDLFRFANVGTALDDRRGKARWNFRWKCLLNERNTTRHVLRIIAQKNADGIFFLTDLALQVRNLRVCSVEDLLSLEHIELRGDSVIKPQLRKFDRIGLRIDCFPRDLELQVELQQSEVIVRYITD